MNIHADVLQDQEGAQAAPHLFNFQAMLAEQGVPFEAGLPPPANNVSDSPLQAWTDMVDSPSSSHSSQDIMMVDIPQEQQANVFSFVSGSLADLTLEKAAMSSVLVPNISLDNTQHITFKV
jgi:hypothetical protein